jgi:hypothetical protein
VSVSSVNKETEQQEKQNGNLLQEYNVDIYTSKALFAALIAIFAALGPSLSVSFIWFPYFEFMTLTIFLGGFILGYVGGICTGLLSATLYEIIASTLVGVALPIFPFKLIAYTLIAVSGAMYKKIKFEQKLLWHIGLIITGGLLTIVFDLIVNLGMLLAMNLQIAGYFAALVTGLFVTAGRTATNMVLFSFIPIINRQVINPLIGSYIGEEGVSLVEKHD